MDRPETGSVLLYQAENGYWLHFARPQQVLTAHTPQQVLPALRQLAAATASGAWVAGFLAYEAAAAFDPACVTAAPGPLPLLWFGLYREPQRIALPEAAVPPPLDWQPQLDAAAFAERVAAVRAAIARGESYQVNLTFPLRAAAPSDPFAAFHGLLQGQVPPYAAYLDTGRFVVASASPELFFRRDGEHLVCRPMKGTARRGRTAAEDRRAGELLRRSAKNRAENVMILDMVRHDLARLGPVTVEALCTLERYPTVWQLTSTVSARTAAPLDQVFAALFPSASITGAPKYRTMQLIRDLEGEPRGLYTGAIGWAGPGDRACFSVAIRSLLVDRQEEMACYGVGAGITWGSRAAAEYRECLAKAAILKTDPRPFELLETLLWTPQDGYVLRERHLRRLGASARYFAYPCNRAELRRELAGQAARLPAQAHRVRLLLGADGRARSEAYPLEPPAPEPLRVRLASRPVASADPFLCHKTTRRDAYEQAWAERAGADEVLLHNERGELTEACHNNLVLKLDGELLTPARRCGLLPGTLRAELLQSRVVREKVLRLADLRRAEEVWLINSVRGWRRAVLVKE